MSRLLRILLPWAQRVRRVYWFVFRPATFGVVCLLEWRGKVLLVEHSYVRGIWMVPGGGIKRGEDGLAAICREVREEVGVDLYAAEHLGDVRSVREYKRDTISCYWAKVDSDVFRIDDREIIDASWFDIRHLPQHTSWLVAEIVDLRHKAVSAEMTPVSDDDQ